MGVHRHPDLSGHPSAKRFFDFSEPARGVFGAWHDPYFSEKTMLDGSPGLEIHCVQFTVLDVPRRRR